MMLVADPLLMFPSHGIEKEDLLQSNYLEIIEQKEQEKRNRKRSDGNDSNRYQNLEEEVSKSCFGSLNLTGGTEEERKGLQKQLEKMAKSPTLITVTDYNTLDTYVRKLDSTIYPKRRPHHPRVVRSYKDDWVKAESEIKASFEFSTSPYSKPNPSPSAWWNPFSWTSSASQSQVKVSPPQHGHQSQSHHHHMAYHAANGSKSMNAEGGSGETTSKGKGGKSGKVLKRLTQTRQHTSAVSHIIGASVCFGTGFLTKLLFKSIRIHGSHIEDEKMRNRIACAMTLVESVLTFAGYALLTIAVLSALSNPVTAPITLAIIFAKALCAIGGNYLGDRFAEWLFGNEKTEEEWNTSKAPTVPDANVPPSPVPIPHPCTHSSIDGYFNSGLCKVCMENPATSIFLHCDSDKFAHFAYCEECRLSPHYIHRLHSSTMITESDGPERSALACWCGAPATELLASLPPAPLPDGFTQACTECNECTFTGLCLEDCLRTANTIHFDAARKLTLSHCRECASLQNRQSWSMQGTNVS